MALLIDEWLVVENVSQLLFVHAAACIADGDFHVVGGFLGANGDSSIFGREFTGIVRQRIQHKERQYAVGLNGGADGFDL